MADYSDLVAATNREAARLGINPSDLLTAISDETGGTLDPWAKGPRTQWGEHRGLIQWGEPQRKQYGVTADMSTSDQMSAVGKYLQDRGLKPGMGMLDLYSTINAGRPGLYNRSDANNGGAPGTVADKVATQMAGHRVRANRLLGLGSENIAGTSPVIAESAPGKLDSQYAAPGSTTSQAAPLSLAPSPASGPAGDAGLTAALAALASIPGGAQGGIQPVEMPAIQYFKPNAQKLAAAMSRLPIG